MSIANCPMCHVEITPGMAQRVCASCGADLSRWMPKVPPKIPALAAGPETPTAASQVVDEPGQFNLGLGILGAFLGAGVSSVLMIGFYLLVGFRFPWFGLGIGALTGFSAKKFYKGTDHTLGLICGGIATATVVGTLFLIYGGFPLLCIISVIVSVGIAYRIAAEPVNRGLFN